MIETVFLIAGGAALLLIGVGLGFWFAQLRSDRQIAQAADVQKQFDDYRQSVTAHFGRTAEHFQAIGKQYRELYEHMASGADTLIDPQAMEEKLSLVPTAAVEPPSSDDEPDEVEPGPGEASEDAEKSPRIYH